MASEAKRGCGYRKVGGMYLVGGSMSIPCDRLPYRLEACPTCGAGIHFTRSLTAINPLELFDLHDDYRDLSDGTREVLKVNCKDKLRPCFMCDPAPEIAYLMMVGERHYPTTEDFLKEGGTVGISKRIPFIPKHLTLGRTIIYLAHNRACVLAEHPPIEEPATITNDSTMGMPIGGDKVIKGLGIFSAFIPRAIEKIYWQSEIDTMSPEDKEGLNKRGITPVGVKDGDGDHK